MKKPKLKKWSKVEIEWLDSCHASGWRDSSELDGEPQIDYRTIGYVLNVNSRSVSVVQSMCDFIKPERSRVVDSCMEIPFVSIKKIKFLK